MRLEPAGSNNNHEDHVQHRWLPTRWWTRGLVVGLGFVLIPYLFSRVASPWRCVRIHSLDRQEAPAAGSSGSLRIVSYNIAHGRGPIEDNWRGGSIADRERRLDAISDLLRELNADVVVLNEVDFDSSWSFGLNQAQYLAERAGYRYRVEQRNLDFRILLWTWRFGNAVLSRYPITNATELSLPGEVPWETILAGKKRGVVCELAVPGGPVRLVAAHLSHRSEAVRILSAKMIVALADDSALPLIVAGDLNSSPAGFPHSSNSANGENAIDVLDSAAAFARVPTKAPITDDMTYDSVQPSAVIDWILIPATWSFRSYRAVVSQLSDHRPIYAEIERSQVAK